MLWGKKLYCLKFRDVKLDVYLGKIEEKPGEQINEYIFARSKEAALKKSKLLKEGKFTFISIIEAYIK